MTGQAATLSEKLFSERANVLITLVGPLDQHNTTQHNTTQHRHRHVSLGSVLTHFSTIPLIFTARLNGVSDLLVVKRSSLSEIGCWDCTACIGAEKERPSLVCSGHPVKVPLGGVGITF